MNYDKIILEMLSRIQNLEEEVAELRQRLGAADGEAADGEGADRNSAEIRVTTEDIRRYIGRQKQQAAMAGEGFLTLRASEIHRAMKLSKRYPMVCNAMRQSMGPADVVVHEPPSGYSSSLEIRYALEDGCNIR